jgi:hypothetical protein
VEHLVKSELAREIEVFRGNLPQLNLGSNLSHKTGELAANCLELWHACLCLFVHELYIFMEVQTFQTTLAEKHKTLFQAIKLVVR